MDIDHQIKREYYLSKKSAMGPGFRVVSYAQNTWERLISDVKHLKQAFMENF